MLRKPTLKNIVSKNINNSVDDEFNSLFSAQSINEKDGNPSIIPLNTNLYLIGNKSSGKSTFINCFIRDQVIKNGQINEERNYTHIFNIHSDNVDSTSNGLIPPNILIDVPTEDAKQVLSTFIKIKHKFLSCVRYVRNNNYSDHIINSIIKMNRLDELPDEKQVSALTDICYSFIDKYTKTFELNEKIKIEGGFNRIGYTLIVIHDANQHADLFGTNARNSFIYYISEVSRHFLGMLLIACQSLDQITACCRKGIVSVGLFKGFTATDLLKLPRLNKELLTIFKREVPFLKRYEAIFMNFDRNEAEILQTDYKDECIDDKLYKNSAEFDTI